MPLACKASELLLFKVMDCQNICCHHDHHGEVEGEQGPDHKEVLVIHFKDMLLWHDIVHVDEGQDRDGGSQQHPQPPGEDHLEQGGVLTL